MRLKDKIAFVTGAGSGIGAAIAERFAAEGAFVYVVDLKLDTAETVASSIGKGQAHPIAADVAESQACLDAAAEVRRRCGRIDILVNNAGIGHVGTLLQTSAADLDRLYAVNVRGVFNMTSAFLPMMLERGSGSIVNTASVGGLIGLVDRLAYCTTKFAVVGFTKCIALDYATLGVRCNCLCPGRVLTPFVEQRIREYPDPAKAFREMSATQPMGRMARPDEIAAAAVFLGGDESSFVTGAALAIDGAMSAG